MREILFRGKRIDNGEWVEGNLVRNDNGKDCFIVFMGDDYLDYFWEIIVDPNTIGQYTGLTDKNGKRIFEGDVVEGMGSLLRVYFDTNCASFDWEKISGSWRESFSGFADEYEVIGNIHDNSELLKGENK